MSENTTVAAVETYSFLNTVKAVYSSLNTIILYASLIIEILWFIMFFYRMIKKDKSFLTPYYVILLIGYFANMVAVGIFVPQQILIVNFKWKTPTSIQIIYNIFYWFMWRFMGPWNTVLAMNRFTGMFFYRKHDKIWEGHWFKPILAFLILYPFALSSPYLNVFFYCLPLAYDNEKCIDFYGANVSYSNLANGIISLILGAATALQRKIRGDKWAKKEKFETYLLVQSIVSTILLCCSESAVLIRMGIGQPINDGIKYLLLAMENWFGQAFYCSSAIMIFCLSTMIRQSFISFYRLYYIPGIKKPEMNKIFSTSTLTNS